MLKFQTLLKVIPSGYIISQFMMNWIDAAVARRNFYYENIQRKLKTCIRKIIYKIISIYLSIKFSYSGLLQMPLVDTRKVYDEVKGIVNVISSDPPSQDANARFTTIPLKALSDQV